MTATRFPLFTAWLLALLLGGCSTFNRDWNRMEQLALAGPVEEAPSAGPLDAMLGRWEGTWQSDSNGHHGALRCIITLSDDAESDVHARFRARYGSIMVFEYAMPMVVECDGDTCRFAASADLGRLAGGVYDYQGAVTGDVFTATYQCKSDRGTFEMRRVRVGSETGS